MKDRGAEDFTGVMTHLPLRNRDIVQAAKGINTNGVYYNPKAKEGFRYAVAFAIPDESGGIWIETFGVERVFMKMILRGCFSSQHVKKGSASRKHLLRLAAELIENQLNSE